MSINISNNSLSLATIFLFALMSDFLCYNFCDPKSIKKVYLASYIPLTFSEASATKSYINNST